MLIYTESRDAPRREALVERGGEVVELATVTPRTVLDDLHRRGIQSVLVEGGGEVLGAFLANDLFDRVEVCCAPLLIGGEGAPGPLRGAGAAVLGDAARLESVRVGRRGVDVIVSGVRDGRTAELVARLAAL